MTTLAVAGVQADLAWEDRGANHAMARREVARAAATGARLVVLPEMWPSGFSMDTAVTAEPPEGPSATLMADLAAQHDLWVAGSFACAPGQRGDQRGDDRPTNRLLLVAPDGSTVHYDKVHPFSYAREHDHFAAGRQAVVAEVDGVRVGLAVCYDLRFANLFWDLGPSVDAFVVPANWPCARRTHWRTLLTARAIENQAWVLGVNRVGLGRRLDGSDLDYCGDSLLVDPLGEVVASAAGQANLLLGVVDTAEVADVRARLPFLPDRRRTDFTPS